MKVSLKWTWIAAGVLAMLILAAPLPSSLAAPVERTFHLEARRFEFGPAVLRVNPGDRVTVELTSTDVVHGLAIDGYGLEMTAEPGQTARLTFVAGKPGAYRFRCSVTCGHLHPFMIGKLYVGQNWLLWRAGLLGVLAAVVGSGIIRFDRGDHPWRKGEAAGV